MHARDPTRREFLRAGTAVGVSVGVGVASGATAPVVAQEATEHLVEMTDGLVFDPDSLTVAPGDTVVWRTVGSVGHSVTAYADGIPEDAEYFASGGFETESAARRGYPRGDVGTDEEFGHTFGVEGEYEYFCIPHESVGMVGTVTVQAGGAAPEPAVELPSVPDAAKSLALAAGTAMVSVVAMAYVLLKYGGDYGGEDDEGRRPVR
ncbi:plastocyanin/azurin family copper-binding protein [Halobium salinum]|uniref:Plastocyanin/azurin family copper-binding protein n=1 Tax=Halobium salinum TaxID=1364940 RepID=A0ABD5P6K5_9EURY|nr:plastocyanin/azurin family copper-binding protein [Halobium salinum]